MSHWTYVIVDYPLNAEIEAEAKKHVDNFSPVVLESGDKCIIKYPTKQSVLVEEDVEVIIEGRSQIIAAKTKAERVVVKPRAVGVAKIYTRKALAEELAK